MSGWSLPIVRCTAIADTNAFLCINQDNLTGLRIGAGVDGEAEVEEEKEEVEEVEVLEEVGGIKQYLGQNRKTIPAGDFSSPVPPELNRILIVSSRG